MSRSLTDEQRKTLNLVKRDFVEADPHITKPPKLATILQTHNMGKVGKGPEYGELPYSTANYFLKQEGWIAERARFQGREDVDTTTPDVTTPEGYSTVMTPTSLPMLDDEDEDLDPHEILDRRRLQIAQNILTNSATSVEQGQGAVAEVANKLLQTVLISTLTSLTTPEELAKMTPANKIQLLSTVQRMFKEFENLLQFELEARKQLRATREEEIQDAMIDLGLMTRCLQDDMTLARRINLSAGLNNE
ncbi:MAG: hypothetical protein ACK5XN_12070 [Bacteroidota bacterium]|jgi:hypothetical protein